MEFVNRICPNCKNPNYMVLLGDFSKAYKYKCINCNMYFNDIDFEEQLQPVWENECMNSKVDMVEVVRCKYCEYLIDHYGFMDDGCCRKMKKENCVYFRPDKNWFCADGKRRDDNA